MRHTTTSRRGASASDRARPAEGWAGTMWRWRVARFLLVPAVPLLVYFAVRPRVGSDAAGLAIAGAVSLVYTIATVLVRRWIDLWAVLTSVGFAVGSVASLLAGGSSLPLKLHQAAVTFVLGVILLAAVLARRPLPAGRLLKVPHADPRLDASLSVMLGAFLVLHALLHVMLAVMLPTATYLVAGRVVDLGTLALGAVLLYSYLRRLRGVLLVVPSSSSARSNRQTDR